MNNKEIILKVHTALEKASEKYVDSLGLRALVQVIPYIGGPLDTLISGKGGEIQRKRIELFLCELGARLKKVEEVTALEPDERLYDFMVTVFESVVRSNSKQKIKYFASLVKNQIVARAPWDSAETAARLLADLSDMHLRVLIAILNAPAFAPPFLKTVSLHRQAEDAMPRTRAKALIDQFPEHDTLTLEMICAELISKGLLRDEGVRRLDAEPMEIFVATALAEGLITWLADEVS